VAAGEGGRAEISPLSWLILLMDGLRRADVFRLSCNDTGISEVVYTAMKKKKVMFSTIGLEPMAYNYNAQFSFR